MTSPHDSLLDSPLGELESCGVLSLIEELELLAPVSSASLPRVTLWQFLTLCLYPEGMEGKRRKLSGGSLPDSALLNQTLRSLAREESSVFPLCEAIARRNATSVEFHLGQRLTTFLNGQIPKLESKKRR